MMLSGAGGSCAQMVFHVRVRWANVVNVEILFVSGSPRVSPRALALTGDPDAVRYFAVFVRNLQP